MEKRNVCVVGLGYVGLTLATVLAEVGYEVSGVEINPEILAALQRGKPHFFEPGLESRLNVVMNNGSFKYFESIAKAQEIRDFEIFIITVGTPLDDNGNPRMDMVERVAAEIGRNIHNESLVILRSTVALGTTKRIEIKLSMEADFNVLVAFCPERTLEGNALSELRELPQIIGSDDESSRSLAAKFFEVVTPVTIKMTSSMSAELVKLMDNTFRDMSFAFSNQLALIADSMGIDAHEVVNSANLGYPRTNIALPGLVGGPCLSKDAIILSRSISNPQDASLSVMARNVNLLTTKHVANQILSHCRQNYSSKVLVSGLAFKGKPATDDLRGSPTLDLLHLLGQMEGIEIECHDFEIPPQGIIKAGFVPGNIQGLTKYEVVIIANNHAGYSSVRTAKFSEIISKGGLLYDLWGVTRNMPKSDFHYISRKGLGWS
jgi:UDP-N-acetyl-D-mannosaminuronic acid dehydrogenase